MVDKEITIDSWSIVMTTDSGKNIPIDNSDISDYLAEQIDSVIENDLKHRVTWRE